MNTEEIQNLVDALQKSQTEEIQKIINSLKESQKNWYDPDDLQLYYGILKSTQAKMRMAKTLPYHKVGKYVRYHRPDIDKLFLDAKVV